MTQNSTVSNREGKWLLKKVRKFLPVLIFGFLFFPMGSWLKIVYCKTPLPELENVKTVKIRLYGAENCEGKTVSYTIVRSGGNPKIYDDIISKGLFTITSNGSGEVIANLYQNLNDGSYFSNNMLIENISLVDVYLALDLNNGFSNTTYTARKELKLDAQTNKLIEIMDVQRLEGKKMIISGNTDIAINHFELSHVPQHSTVSLTLTGFTNYITDRVIYKILRRNGNPTNENHILGKGYISIDSNGMAQADIYMHRGWYSEWSTSILYDDICMAEAYIVVDENRDWWTDTRANGDDLILEERPFLVFGDTDLEIKPQYMEKHIPGFTPEEYALLTNLASIYNQGSSLALTAEIERAMELVSTNTYLIMRHTDRKAFLQQNPTNAAGKLCTVIHRYIYLRAVELLYPQAVTNLTPNFANFYLQAVNKGYVIEKSGVYCYTYNGPDMVKDYLVDTNPDWKYFRNTDFTNNSQGIDLIKEKGAQVVLIREGENENYGNHTFLAVLHTDGVYRMVDAGYKKWMNLPLEERFGTNSGKYLISITGYLPTEL